MAPARPITPQPLWVRVDENRVKLAVFVCAFVAGSAVLLTAALIALPGALLGWGASTAQLVPAETWFRAYPWVVGGTFALLLLIGSFMSTVQIANAEDWVRNRFAASPVAAESLPGIQSAIEDMSIAAGLPVKPRLLLLDVASVNACAIGASRKQPSIGVTQGFLTALADDEQRAVLATLIARIAAGDILFGTALAALMGPIKAVRGSGRFARAGADGCAGAACSSPDLSGCGDGCRGCDGCSGLDDLDLPAAGGCGYAVLAFLFLLLVAAVTYAAVLSAAWIVTLWGRALHRTSYEKADAEGMLLLKDPSPMLSALAKVIASSNEIGDGDSSYDGIFYAATSGKPAIEKVERRRYERLRQVLGVEGAAAPLPADG